MLPPFDFAASYATALDVMAAGSAHAAALAARRERRLAALLATAVKRSPLYRNTFGGAQERRCRRAAAARCAGSLRMRDRVAVL